MHASGWPRASFFGLVVFVWMVFGGAPLVHAQVDPVPDDIRAQATADVHGPDGQGKDGPLAKVGFDLTRLYHAHRAHRASGAKQPFGPEQRTLLVRDGYVTVDAVAEHDAARLLDALRALGLEGGARAGRMVSGRLPLTAIPDAAALAVLRFARPARMIPATGSVTSQGDTAMNADGARMLLNVDGSGITVGALSDSYDDHDGSPATTASDDVASGDLPGTDNPNGFTTPVAVLDDSQGPEKDEGRAMLQIIHDVAPGAELAFHTAFGGQANFVNGIRALADAGADVVVDDVLYLAEPMFQDGPIAQVVDSVKSEGVAYFSSAGNLADQSYESSFRLEGTAHDFDSGSGVDTLQAITIPENTTATFILQWDDPFASAGGTGADTDLDIVAIDVDGDSVAAASTDPNIGGDAVEILDIENPTGSVKEYELRIVLAGGPAPGQIKYVYYPDEISFPGGDDYGDAGAPTLYGHANAKGAEAVAAASFSGARSPRSYTALGGVPVLFNPDGTINQGDFSRQKPGIAAPDCVDNTFFGSGNTFCGTSAAAPHAAAVAALMLENRPDLTVDELYGDLRATANDIGPNGEDDWSGFGFIDASNAALPVELVAFDAVADEGTVLLTWQTASETRNAGFDVQHRSLDDEAAWTTAVFVEGAGTTSAPQSYRYRVEDIGPGRHAFRLRQIDTDGTVHVSSVVEAMVGMERAYQLAPLYPNPVQTRGTLELRVREAQTVEAAAYDVRGRRVQLLYDGPAAAYRPLSLTLQAEMLPSGLYLIRVQGETFSATRRATVVH